MTTSCEPVFFDIPITTAKPPLAAKVRSTLMTEIADLLRQKNAVIIAHYYTDPDIQELAEKTQGFIGDSLAMAQFGHEHPANILVIAGVRFMGESAKILNPEKKIIMPTLQATCSMDLGCPPERFNQFCAAHPDRTVVVYANTSAQVKARADWVVTSSNAIDIIDHLDAQGKKILWAPDRYLGNYLQQQTGADMLMWQGACVVHEEFKANGLRELKKQYPTAAVLVHPESPQAVIAMADVVGSTTKLLKASQELPNTCFIVATDRGIFYKMQQLSANKKFIQAPTGGEGATCRSCGHCPWMAMNSLSLLKDSLLNETNEIHIEPETIKKAQVSLQRMMDFRKV